MMRLNLRQRVSNTSLPRSNPLLPVLEAVVNSFQSLEELGTVSGKFIRITVERDPVVLEEEVKYVTSAPITGFVIEDNGVGFNDANMASFLTSDSDYKAANGGNGVGRFMWLKAFGRAEAESTFGNGALKERDFIFSLGTELNDVAATPSKRAARPDKGSAEGLPSALQRGSPTKP